MDPMDVVADAVAYVSAKGVLMARRDGPGFDTAPFAFAPRPFPRREYEQALALGPLFSRVVDAVSRDTRWLLETLRSTAEGDAFTGRLVSLAERVEKEGARQRVSLLLLRSDYMLDEGARPARGPRRLLQVEINTIAASFGTLTGRVAGWHREAQRRVQASGALASAALLREFGLGARPGARAGKEGEWSIWGEVRENAPSEGLAEGLAQAVDAYCAAVGGGLGRGDVVAVMVVQPTERNTWDQRGVSDALATRGVQMLRRSLAQLAADAVLEDAAAAADARVGDASPGRRLFLRVRVDGEERRAEVAVAYFRAGYDPADYPSEAEWDGRWLLERSAAIKAPDVFVHLAGTKRVQQALAAPGAVERFVATADDARQLRACFAGLWPLDADDLRDPASDAHAAVQRALASPHEFVVKPQREGGGHNFYGADVLRALRDMSPAELGAHILMERIHPRVMPSTMVWKGRTDAVPALCELGIYAVRLSAGLDHVMHDRVVGHLLRTKAASSDEGGVAAGFAVIDSPLLVDDDDYLALS